jgi:5-methylthioadenosine/S-adenosylhomocysteine deaminase
MTSADALLENHTLVVRDGRIIDVLPSLIAAQRYAGSDRVERSHHVLMPGLIDAHTCIVPHAARAPRAEHVRDAALLGIAAMLRAGTTCFCAMGYFPEESARMAAAQGMRAVIGLPIAEVPSPWAGNPGEYFSRAVDLRDEFVGHPSITTAFAPLAASHMSDSTLARVSTLANEVDAGIMVCLHESAREIEDCVGRHGMRPIERLHALGLLTPALTAAHMAHVSAADIALAQRSGMAITLCAGANLRAGHGAPPAAAWTVSGLRVSVGTGAAIDSADLWSELHLLALFGGPSRLGDWDVLALATRGAAAAIGLDAEIGTLESGKWADLCCIDLLEPALLRSLAPAATRLLFGGGRANVSDVWVAGRHLLNDGAFTRLDWPDLAARMGDERRNVMMGE